MMKSLSAKGIEKFLRIKGLDIEQGAFEHIPHYARDEAVEAIRRVRDLERKRLFRPGLYYIVLSDLCRSTEVSARLGSELNKKRIESFVAKCIEILGSCDTRNYSLFLREIGDAVLIIFSSFHDAFDWWKDMESWLDTQNALWSQELTAKDYKQFFLEAKTIIHAGEVSYSGENVPVAEAVNQVFKVEKLFKAGELGISHPVLMAAGPVIRDLGLKPRKRATAILPGEKTSTVMYLACKVLKRKVERPR